MWAKDEADSGTHLAQLYGDDHDALIRNAGRFLRRGLRRGDGIVVAAAAEHARAFTQELAQEAAYDAAMRERRLVWLNAEEVLAHVMVEGAPDRERFDVCVGAVVRDLRQRVGRDVRMFGEMVGVLWREGKPDAASRLEDYWNALLKDRSLHLYCAYPIDIFSPDFEINRVDGLLCSHTRLISSDPAAEAALRQAMDECLGPKAEGLELLIEALDRPYWAVMPKVEAMILWLKNILPEDAERILECARQHMDASAEEAIP